MTDGAYRQTLEGLELSIERDTERTPDRSRYHVFRKAELVDSYRRLSDAQARFKLLRDESGWQPPNDAQREGSEQLRREAEAQERLRQAEHWHRTSSRRGWFKGHRW